MTRVGAAGGAQAAQVFQRRLAWAHGGFHVLSGVWPLVDMGSFERVSGPKVDRWLVRTVAGLLVVNGLTQIAATRDRDGLRSARRLGQGTAGVLGAVDLVYGIRGRISRVYLADAVIELAWIWAWTHAQATGEDSPGSATSTTDPA
jgi:hypothetical protein